MISLRAALLIVAAIVLMLFAQYAKSEEAELTSDEIYMAQTILFENGFVNVGIPDGVIGPNTRAAISLWQEFNNYPITGVLSSAELQELAELGIPNDYTWMALSLSIDGQYSVVSQGTSGVAVARVALADCQSVTVYPETCTTGAVWADQQNDGWIAGYQCEAGENAFVAVSIGISREMALRSAYSGVEAENLYQPWQCIPVYFSISGTDDPLAPEAVVDEEVH